MGQRVAAGRPIVTDSKHLVFLLFSSSWFLGCVSFVGCDCAPDECEGFVTSSLVARLACTTGNTHGLPPSCYQKERLVRPGRQGCYSSPTPAALSPQRLPSLEGCRGHRVRVCEEGLCLDKFARTAREQKSDKSQSYPEVLGQACVRSQSTWKAVFGHEETHGAAAPSS
ncbi:hypothetical protein UPYG_G00252350 [Umbra pygmaea]|uniref:Secreted protein n=1 Tax=Umbra pygmaea TaxID=75934 RepID=A0ABD0WRM3_UMBPY